MNQPWRVLASDYDRTLAIDGRVSAAALGALRRLKTAGAGFILVTGRCLPDLTRLFPELAVADVVVAENGAVLHLPSTGEVRLLAAAPHLDLAELLAARGVPELEVGEVIIAMPREHESTAVECLAALGLARSVIPNRDRVMLLPMGVDKASGLAAALHELAVPPADAVGIGDGENDLALLTYCGLGVAVSDAEPVVLAAADLVSAGGASVGVIEIVEKLLLDDLPRSRDHDQYVG